MKHAICILLAAIVAGTLCAGALCACSSVERGVTVVSADGSTLATLSDAGLADLSLTDEGYLSYVDAAWSEACALVAKQEGISSRNAGEYLIKNGCTVATAFRADCFGALRASYEKNFDGSTAPFACAMTDLAGGIVAIYSAGGNGSNYALMTAQPYSSFKPLSVYAPVIEARLETWSSMVEDSPYKQIEDSSGALRGWPQNATGMYADCGVTIYEAVRQSLNTVAVKCLAEYGVKRSLAFLRERFGLTLDSEATEAELHGEEEVIGAVAMGYLIDGVTPVEMAGYYQVFAAGGVYVPPGAVTKIETSDGDAVYTRDKTGAQSLDPATACVVAHLLEGVVTPGGTGEKAAVANLEVGGKTGTGDDHVGNWFVGFSPEFSLAVWHGAGLGENRCPQIFSDAISAIPHRRPRLPDSADTEKLAYCAESGMLLSDGCRRMEVGYYLPDAVPEKCRGH